MYLFLCIFTYVPSCCLVFSLVVCRNVPILLVFWVLLSLPKNAQFRRIMWRSFYFLLPSQYSHFRTFIYETFGLHWSVLPCSYFLHVSVHAYAHMSRFHRFGSFVDMMMHFWFPFLCMWECFCARFVHTNTLLATFISLLFVCCVCMRASDGDPLGGSTLSVANSASLDEESSKHYNTQPCLPSGAL